MKKVKIKKIIFITIPIAILLVAFVVLFTAFLEGNSEENNQESSQGYEENKENSQGDLIQIDFNTVHQFLDGEKDGFFLAVYDKEESFFYTLDDVVKDRGVLINYYYTYEPDGTDGDVVDRQVFNVSNKFDKNRLYYVKNGEVIDYIRLKSFAGLELSKRVGNFIDTYSEEVVLE